MLVNKRIIAFTIGLTVLVAAFFYWRLQARQSVVFSGLSQTQAVDAVNPVPVPQRLQPAQVVAPVSGAETLYPVQNPVINNPNQAAQDVQSTLRSVRDLNKLNKTHEQMTNPEKPAQQQTSK